MGKDAAGVSIPSVGDGEGVGALVVVGLWTGVFKTGGLEGRFGWQRGRWIWRRRGIVYNHGAWCFEE